MQGILNIFIKVYEFKSLCFTKILKKIVTLIGFLGMNLHDYVTCITQNHIQKQAS